MRLRSVQEHPEAFIPTIEELDDQKYMEMTVRIKPTDLSWFLGAFENGELVGAMSWKREEPAKLQHKSHIYGVYVVPEARRKGIGRALLEHLISRVKKVAGVEQILLTVANSNPAKSLYLQCGFISYGYEKKSLKIGEAYVDGVLMVLFLKD
ncbi:Acetyltransferase (GNAT) family protein [Seinonella peptonophila]|uniref:Acetyltransferase (GNAT) family protein n=1 Tax=Seinonella peptonophila TaxID=112248 RepID=A0A1M4YRA3_9BACL|nr:Acetyltransferase (GNAT) family protein [Seinonella peptonophila]